MRLSLLIALTLLAAAGCGGQVAGPIDAGAGDGQAADATSDVKVDAPPAVDCTKLAADIGDLEEQARTCCAFCNSVQCSHVVDGLCCPVSITSDQAPALAAALAKFKAAGCVAGCPAVLCPTAPSNVCGPGKDPNGAGRCQ